MVAPHQAGTSKPSARAARLEPHDKFTARITHGLEPALVDNAHIAIHALDPSDHRVIQLRVAGPAALLSAKAIKIGERLEQSGARPDRLKAKDALDAFRILQAIDTPELVRGFRRHEVDEHAATVSAEALELYRVHASAPTGRFAELATVAAQGDPTVAPAFSALVSGLLVAL